jgi:hypothetical protein
VYLNNGSGNLINPRDWFVDSSPVGIIAADFNNDLRDDLAVLSDDTVHLLKANSDGTFSDFSPASISTGSSGNVAIAAGRINTSHNYVDLAISSAGSNSVSVLFGNNDGTFQSPFVIVASPVLSNPQGLAIGEFDGDNAPDIAVISGQR